MTTQCIGHNVPLRKVVCHEQSVCRYLVLHRTRWNELEAPPGKFGHGARLDWPGWPVWFIFLNVVTSGLLSPNAAVIWAPCTVINTGQLGLADLPRHCYPLLAGKIMLSTFQNATGLLIKMQVMWTIQAISSTPCHSHSGSNQHKGGWPLCPAHLFGKQPPECWNPSNASVAFLTSGPLKESPVMHNCSRRKGLTCTL